MKKKLDLFELLEQTSSECCEELDKACYEMVEKHGYNTHSLKKCRQALNKDHLGVIFNYAYKEENIYLWWELWKYEKNNPTEKIDTSKKIKVTTQVIKNDRV